MTGGGGGSAADRRANLRRARDLLRQAGRVLILTGSGVSAESGVPTFRGEAGLWREYRPEELATPRAFDHDPRLVWEWYQWRRDLVQRCEPNASHEAIAATQLRRPDVVLVSQNVDGLHERALRERLHGAGDAGDDGQRGARPPTSLFLHGSLFRVRCTACGREAERLDPVDASSQATLPRCPSCGGLERPAVVWFGEALDPEVLALAFETARAAEVCLVAGTSSRVHPAASLPGATAESGGVVIEVNPEETPVSALAAVRIPAAAGEVLPVLLGE